METFNFTTTSQTILADLYTPVGVYMRLRDLYPQSALMECADYHDAASSRSFIGINPMASIAIGHGVATATFPDGTTESKPLSSGFGSAEAIRAAYELTRMEGIIPALESAHAIAALQKMTFKKDDVVVLTVSGRGDKDVETYLNNKHMAGEYGNF